MRVFGVHFVFCVVIVGIEPRLCYVTGACVLVCILLTSSVSLFFVVSIELRFCMQSSADQWKIGQRRCGCAGESAAGRLCVLTPTRPRSAL